MTIINSAKSAFEASGSSPGKLETHEKAAIESFLANLLIEIGVSIKTDQAFRPDINYDLQNPTSVILLVEDAIRQLNLLGQKTANPRQNSELTATEPGSAQEPEVGFQSQAKVLYRSAEQRIITYVPDDGVHFIDDAELEPIRRVYALIGGQE